MKLSVRLLVGTFLALAVTSAATADKEKDAKKADHVVKMIDDKFDKMDIKIKVGQSVMWHNDGCNTHTATSDDGTDKELAFDTGDVKSGKDSKLVTFNKAGTVKYHCIHHGPMKGTITIEDAPKK